MRALKAAGLKQVQLSVQAPDRALNELLVGLDVFDHKIEIARAIKAEGLPMVLNIPVSRYNIERTQEFIDLAEISALNMSNSPICNITTGRC